MMKKLFFPFLMLFATNLRADFGTKTQTELHIKYQDLEFGLQDVLIYARLDGAFNLPRTWQLYLRLDLPYMMLWGKDQEMISIGDDGLIVPPERATHTIMKEVAFKEVGLADVGSRFFFVTPFLDENKRVTVGFGSEFGFPTAQEPDLGTGKYWARPMLGIKWDFPTLGNGSWVSLLGKYQFSYTGHKNREPFQIFAIQPVFVYTFGHLWALVFSPEIQYNVRSGTWFVPLPINLTKAFTRNFSLSASYQRGIITDFPVFQDEVELTIRYTF